MTDNCLFVHGLTSNINLPILQQLFSFYGNCQIQHAGEQALVQYQTHESCLQAMQFLDNTNLLSANGQTNVSMQIVDIAALARQTAGISNLTQPTQNLVPNNNRSVPKKSQNKEFQNDNQRNYSMNIENRERSNSPFQSNNVQVQNNAGRSLGKNMNITPNTKLQQQQQQQQNNNGNMLRNLPGGSMNKIMNDKENFRSTIQNQKLPVFGGPNFDHNYLKSKANPNPKVSTLIDFYKTNKTNVSNDKVKVFSNYDEFWQDMKKMPRGRESNNSYSEIRPTQKPINYDKYTIAELTIELKKRGHIMSGTKQTLRYALEQLNEGL